MEMNQNSVSQITRAVVRSLSQTGVQQRLYTPAFPADDFIRSWGEVFKSDGTIVDFCKLTGMSLNAARGRESDYRSRGIKLDHLKAISVGRAKLDIDRLNKLYKQTVNAKQR